MKRKKNKLRSDKTDATLVGNFNTNNTSTKKLYIAIIIGLVLVLLALAGGYILRNVINKNSDSDEPKVSDISYMTEAELEELIKTYVDPADKPDLARAKAEALYVTGDIKKSSAIYNELQEQNELDTYSEQYDYGIILVAAGKKNEGLEALKKAKELVEKSNEPDYVKKSILDEITLKINLIERDF